MPACSFGQGGSHRRGGAFAPANKRRFSHGYQQAIEPENRRAEKTQKCITVVKEVETLQDLGSRMQGLALSLPEGSRIYLRVRGQTTIH
jgi:hypothetical protein